MCFSNPYPHIISHENNYPPGIFVTQTPRLKKVITETEYALNHIIPLYLVYHMFA